MTDTNALDRLAELAGIEHGWWDFFGQWRVVPAQTKQAFLTAMGFAVHDDQAVQASLEAFENRPWQRWLDPVAVYDQTWQDLPSINLSLPASMDQDVLSWNLNEELGVAHNGSFQVNQLEWLDERVVEGQLVKRWRFRLPSLPSIGYHRFGIFAPNGQSAFMRIIMAPARAYQPECLSNGRKSWGIATQIYALRSASDWGLGTYKGLEDLAVGAAALGADTIGINPLHALFAADPSKFSPYAPSSRRFLNTAYIDVEKVPEFAESREAKRQFASPGFQANIARLRGYPMVEYEDVIKMQRATLELLYHHFRQNHLDQADERGLAFRKFQSRGGRIAQLFCIFEVLHDKFSRDGRGYWKTWPEEYQHPDSPAVTQYAQTHVEKVEFHWWLQFVADSQLGDAHHRSRHAGAAIGLYRDLGVGIAGDGADAWIEQDKLALGVSVGAPPDPLALKGQDWGLLPFNPITLRESGYAPFIAVLSANMRHAGALRLDHAMLLQRLYWVPPGVDADQGAYVRYPADDLFRIVALESYRNRCMVIGEDLGTVPDGFRDRMDRTGLFSYRVMAFEKSSPERFKSPAQFDEQALCIFSTHDLPSLRGWWNEADIRSRIKLNLYPRPGMDQDELTQRQQDRQALVATLHEAGLLPADFPVDPPLDEAHSCVLADAVHTYLAEARSRLMMVQIEDILAMDSQMNLPGTVTEHPNWRRRFPIDAEALLNHPRLRATAESMVQRRQNRMS